MNWTECEHEWRELDTDIGGERTDVVCSKCDCPGERDDRTGEVFWPAT